MGSSGNSSTTSSGGSYLQSSNNSASASAESFVDQLKRSASSVNPKNRTAPIAKPIRRSKSQRSQNFVTSIQHGGSVTLVSLNGELDEQGKPNSEIKHVHHHHFVQDWDGNGMHPGGTQTLPNRKSGNKKSLQASLKPSSADDSSVAIIKKQGLNGVKIQLNLNEQVHAEHLNQEGFVEPCPELDISQKLEKQREK